MPDAVYIGHGLCRLDVAKKAQRARLAKIPQVQLVDTRAIFPADLKGAILDALQRRARPKADATQTDLFGESKGGAGLRR